MSRQLIFVIGYFQFCSSFGANNNISTSDKTQKPLMIKGLTICQSSPLRLDPNVVTAIEFISSSLTFATNNL